VPVIALAIAALPAVALLLAVVTRMESSLLGADRFVTGYLDDVLAGDEEPTDTLA